MTVKFSDFDDLENERKAYKQGWDDAVEKYKIALENLLKTHIGFQDYFEPEDWDARNAAMTLLQSTDR
jgi:hypothetical protein